MSDVENNTGVTVLNNTKFKVCRNLKNRPIELIFDDELGPQRIKPKESPFYVDETRLANCSLAKKQFDTLVRQKVIRVAGEGVEL